MTSGNQDRREHLLQELTAKLADYRDTAQRSARGSRTSAASAADLNRLHLDLLLRLHREIADLAEAIQSLPRPEGPAFDDRRAHVARQLHDAEQALAALGERDDARRSTLELEVRHFSLLRDLV